MSDKKPEDEGTPTEVPFLKMLDEFAATGITLCPEYVAQLREQYGQSSSFGEMRLTRGMAAEFSLTQQMAYRLFDLGAVLDCPVEVIDATPVDFVEGDDMVDACVVAMRRVVEWANKNNCAIPAGEEDEEATAGTTTWSGTLMHDGAMFTVEERFLEDAVVQLATIFKAVGTEKPAVPPVAEHLGAPASGYPLAELVKAVPEQAARRALLLIAEYLDEQEWDSDTCSDVARVMTEAGIPLKDVE